MSKKISRRDFLKLAGAGAATGAVLTGCGPASRYVVREPYTEMPEYTFNGKSTYFATTCRECSAGCGLVVRTFQGRALKTEGNPHHPVSMGKTCPRGQVTVQGLYNPDRNTDPVQQSERGSGNFSKMDWNAAVQVVGDALQNSDPAGIAFLLGTAPDHLFDLVSDLSAAIGSPAPIRYSALSMFESRATLVRAAEQMLGEARLPFFDLANASMTFSFGANFLETWLSPVAFNRAYSSMRKQRTRGYLVQFEPRMSQTGASADEWVPLRAGTEGMVAMALGRLAAERGGGTAPQAFAGVDVQAASEASGIPIETLDRLAGMFSEAERPLAIPGGAALGQTNGLGIVQAVLALNAQRDNFGQAGGVSLAPMPPAADTYHAPASMQEMAAFVDKLNSGGVQVLFVHGVNPLFELPKALGFEEAMQNVPLVISFATFPDETALQSDYIFPDNHGLESWGYQRIAAGVSQSTLSSAQPVVVPYYNTRSTADVLLAAASAAGGQLASALPFQDEVAFIQDKLQTLVGQPSPLFNADEINAFTAYFQQFGGWWEGNEALQVPPSSALDGIIDLGEATFQGEGEFFLASLYFTDAGRIRREQAMAAGTPGPDHHRHLEQLG